MASFKIYSCVINVYFGINYSYKNLLVKKSLFINYFLKIEKKINNIAILRNYGRKTKTKEISD